MSPRLRPASSSYKRVKGCFKLALSQVQGPAAKCPVVWEIGSLHNYSDRRAIHVNIRNQATRARLAVSTSFRTSGRAG